jgi:hypothetical protein
MKAILADGQCHYSMYVETVADAGPDVARRIKDWQAAVRTAGGFSAATPEALFNEIRGIPGVTRVIPAGPRSALPLALRMACGLTGRRGIFASHCGKGMAADAIRDEISLWNVDLHSLHELDSDMPLSVMVKDPYHPLEHETVTLYPLSRKKYRHRSVYPADLLAGCDAMLLNRVNQGILDAAQSARKSGVLINLRIHGYSRHVSFADFRPLLPFVHQLVIDSGHNSLRDTARALGLKPPRGWPDRGPFPPGLLRELATALDAIAGRRLFHAFVINGRDTLHLLGSAGHVSATRHLLIPTGRICDIKITARCHGAMLAATILNKPAFDLDPESHQPRSEDGLQAMANWILAAAQAGVLDLPWQWPGADFVPAQQQMEIA